MKPRKTVGNPFPPECAAKSGGNTKGNNAMTPANERKAQERKRKREAGLVPLEVWVPASKVIEARAAIEKVIAAVDRAVADNA